MVEGKQIRLLVIDDDITSLDIVSFLFETSGFYVARCSSGKEAIVRVVQEKPSLLLVDIMMPEMNGIETVREIRSMGLNDVPVVAFTAVSDVDLHQQALDAGCNEVVTKPCPPEKLLKIISKYLSSSACP